METRLVGTSFGASGGRMSKFKIDDRVMMKPTWANPDVLVIQSLSEDETTATVHTELGPKLAVIEDVPVENLEPAPPLRDGWMQ